MNTKLVCSARLRFKFKQRVLLPLLQHTIFGDGRLALGSCAEGLWLFWVTLNRHINDGVVMRHVAYNYCNVCLLGFSLRKLFLKKAQCWLILGTNDYTAG